VRIVLQKENQKTFFSTQFANLASLDRDMFKISSHKIKLSSSNNKSFSCVEYNRNSALFLSLLKYFVVVYVMAIQQQKPPVISLEDFEFFPTKFVYVFLMTLKISSACFP
jgi:hypothetical protein